MVGTSLGTEPKTQSSGSNVKASLALSSALGLFCSFLEHGSLSGASYFSYVLLFLRLPRQDIGSARLCSLTPLSPVSRMVPGIE